MAAHVAQDVSRAEPTPSNGGTQPLGSPRARDLTEVAVPLAKRSARPANRKRSARVSATRVRQLMILSFARRRGRPNIACSGHDISDREEDKPEGVDRSVEAVD